MSRGSARGSGGRKRARRVAVGAAAAALTLLPAAPALAHGGGDAKESRVLVLDALSFLANRPAGYEDMVMDKVGDALDAPDKDGVDLAAVTKAQAALKAGDLSATRTLLQSAVLPMDEPVTGEEPGTTAMLDPWDPSVSLGGLDGVLAALSAAALAGGVVLAVRSRPHDSIRVLNTRLSGGRP